MRVQKYAAIERYLAEHIPNSGIEQANDFNLSAQRFKVQIEKNSLLLKVSEAFVDDNEIDEILLLFDCWEIPGLLQQDSSRTIFVGNEGFQSLKRE